MTELDGLSLAQLEDLYAAGSPHKRVMLARGALYVELQVDIVVILRSAELEEAEMSWSPAACARYGRTVARSVRMSRRTRAAYDEWAATYDLDPNPQTVLEETDVLSLVDARAGDIILDAACGTGRYARRFLDGGARVVGFDNSPPMLCRARAKCPEATFLLADLTGRLPIGEGTFDKVCCAQTLKHLPDLDPPVTELGRVLRTGGSLTFAVTHPDMDFTGYELRDPPGFVLSARADIHHHSRSDYLEAIGRAGLVLIEERTVCVDERVVPFLTPASFHLVEGRAQIAIFHARRP